MWRNNHFDDRNWAKIQVPSPWEDQGFPDIRFWWMDRCSDGTKLSDDMYMRLPWEYPNVQTRAEDFIRLRHALVPYTYILASESSKGGMCP